MTGTQGEGHLTETTAHGWGPAHDRRRTHYLKALELLGNASAITRLGGVRLLAQLADEWLADASIPAPVGREQAQTIVDMLCAYVRLPFPLARNCPQAPASTPERSSDTGMARQHRIDEAEYLAEAQVRSRILAEIRGRVRQPQPLEDAAAGGEAAPGPWSGFDFDFSGAEFFDTVDFSGCYWDGRLTFAGSTFCGAASFSNSVYRGQAGVSFEECTYRAGTCPGATAPVGADFSGSYYGGFVSFAGSTYEADACFSGSVYCAGANAQDCTYMADSIFSGCTHYGPVARTGAYGGTARSILRYHSAVRPLDAQILVAAPITGPPILGARSGPRRISAAPSTVRAAAGILASSRGRRFLGVRCFWGLCRSLRRSSRRVVRCLSRAS